MESPDDLAPAFPAPRDDEPPDLRRKIIAELRDHLHSAMQRELLLTGNAGLTENDRQAQQNVLSRFGDPARLARKLWYDAMWEKIMTQRMMLATLVLVVLVSVGSTGLTWFLVVQAGQVNQALLEQNRAVNELMLAKLTALENAGGNAGKSMEWTLFKVRLSGEKPGGAAAGFKLSLQGHILDTGGAALLNRTTGPDGIADFGLVRPGQHELVIEAPWGESIAYRSDGQLVTVLPGEPQTLEIVCPSKPEETEITIAIDWPNDLAGQPLWLVCDFVRSPREVGGQIWTRSTDYNPRYVVVDPMGKLTTNDRQSFGSGQDESSRATFKFFHDGEGFYVDRDKILRSHVEGSNSDTDSPGIYRYIEPDAGWRSLNDESIRPRIWFPKTVAVSSLKWPAGTYSVSHIAVGLESETKDESLPDDMLHPIFLGGIALQQQGGNDDNTAVRLLYPDEKQASVRRRNRREAKPAVLKFEAVAGRLNEWRLSLPQPLVDLVNAPPVKPETDGEAWVPNLVPQYGAPAPNRGRRGVPQLEQLGEDMSVDEDNLPLRPGAPRVTPEDDTDGPVVEDDARPRRKPRAIPVDDADFPQ